MFKFEFKIVNYNEITLEDIYYLKCESLHLTYKSL